MKSLFVVITLAVLTITSVGAQAAMVMKKKAAAPEAGQTPAPAPAETSAPAKAKDSDSAKAPAQAQKGPSEESSAPSQAASGETKPEGDTARAEQAKKPFKQGYVGSVAYVQGEKALIDCTEALPPNTYMVVYDEKFVPRGIAVLGKPKGKNMYLAKIAEGDVSVGDRVSIETEEGAFLRVSKNKSPEAVKEFAALYPNSPRRAELEK